MNPARVFAKMTAQPSRLDGGLGGITEYDEAFCASLATRLDRRYWMAARIKWCADWSVANELEYLVWIAAVGIAAEQKWRIPKGREYVRKMAGLAIFELADPARCKKQTKKAEFVGVSRSQWSRVWRARYECIYSELNDWTNIAYGHIQKMQCD